MYKLQSASAEGAKVFLRLGPRGVEPPQPTPVDQLLKGIVLHIEREDNIRKEEGRKISGCVKMS
jgi:hypothetical protein